MPSPARSCWRCRSRSFPSAPPPRPATMRPSSAAREIQAARDRANEAADLFFQAQSDLELLQDDAHRLEREAVVLEDRVEQLRRDVESLPIARFAASGSRGHPAADRALQAPKDQVQAEVFADVVTNAGSSALDEFDFAQKDLAAKQDELETPTGRDRSSSRSVFTELQAQAEAEVDRLREIEEQRLTDEAVRQALAAQQAAALAQARGSGAAPTRRQRVVRLPNPGVVAAEAAAAEAAAAAAAAAAGDEPDSMDTASAPTFPPTDRRSSRRTERRRLRRHQRRPHRYRWRRQQPDRGRQRRRLRRCDRLPDARVGVRRHAGERRVPVVAATKASTCSPRPAPRSSPS